MTPTIELLPHNQMLYDKIVEQIEKGERSIFYSEATGLGKSFIFMRLVQKYFTGKRVLYIVPKIAIWDNLTHYKEFNYLDSKIEMRTFASFNKYDSKDELYKLYDTVFVDECHHMLSDIQGINVAEFLNDMVNHNKCTFGMTATPYYKGTYVDEMWFDVSCYGYDVFEAIDNGILPKVKLALADIDVDTIPSDLRAQFSVTGTKSLLTMLLEEHSEINKWLAYFSNVSMLEQNVNEMKNLFPDYEILKVYDGIENEYDIFRSFEQSNKKVVLMSVNKLLEGIHLDGVEGVLLYRNVVEFSTWMQMYGRLCNINTRTTPVFLDVTNAIVAINKVSEFKSSRFTGELRSYDIRDIFDVTARDYWTIELSELMRNMSVDSWSCEEDSILKENYPKIGKKVKDMLPGKTASSIYHRANKLGLVAKTIPKFDKWEDDILREEYAKYGTSIRSKLNNRSNASIRQRAKVLGLRYVGEAPALDDEINLFKDMRENGVKLLDIVDELNTLKCNIDRGVTREKTFVQYLVQKYGVYADKVYSDDDKNIFLKYAHEPTRCYICSRLLNKEFKAVYLKYRRIGIEQIPYTIAELTYIRDNMDRSDLGNIVNELNALRYSDCDREIEGVRDHINLIRGTFKYNMTWTTEECEFVKNNYESKGMKYVRDVLFYRSYAGICTKLSDLGIHLPNYNELVEYDFKFSDEKYREVDISSLKSLSKFCGRSVDSIRFTMKSKSMTAREFVDYMLDNSYKGYHFYTLVSDLIKDGYPSDTVKKYRNNHTMEETVDYFVTGEYKKDIDKPVYKCVVLKSPRAVSIQLGISTSTWDKYKKSTGDDTLLGYARYWYHHLIDIGRFEDEEHLDKFILSKQQEHNIKGCNSVTLYSTN